MKKLFEPKSIALIGVSRNPEKLSHVLVRNVLQAGPSSQIFPISRSGGTILGCRAYPDLRALPHPPDLVLISVASEKVKEVIAEAAEVGAGVAVILSSGFGETQDGKGMELESELLAIARGNGLRIMGPNCLGVYNADQNLDGTYLVKPPLHKGNISVASQSGAFGGILVNELNRRGIGLNKFASIGNQIDIRHQDILEYFAEDDGTEVIGLFVEGIKDGPQFLQMLRHVSRIKPVVVFKGGRTKVGRRAAASHTGSMAGEFETIHAAIQQAGAIPALTTDQFHDYLCSLSFNHNRLPKDNSLAIVTISGGPSVVASDFSEEMGLALSPLSDRCKRDLLAYLPSFAAVSNPVDMTVATPPENFGPAVDLVLAEEGVSGAIAVNWGWDRPEFAHAFVNASRRHKKPVVAYAVENPKVQEIFQQNRVLNLPSPESAVRSYWALAAYARRCSKKDDFRDSTSGPSQILKHVPDTPGAILSEYDSKRILNEYGIPTCREAMVEGATGLAQAALHIGYPVVLKVLAEGTVHKTDEGGVILGISDEFELHRAAEKLAQRFPENTRFLVQEHVSLGTEVIIGMKRDPALGPVIAFGLGGIFTEVLEDVAFRVHPISSQDAMEMIQEIKGSKVLTGYRGYPPADLTALVDVILKTAELAVTNSRIEELDMNPLMVNGADLKVVDATIVLKG